MVANLNSIVTTFHDPIFPKIVNEMRDKIIFLLSS